MQKRACACPTASNSILQFRIRLMYPGPPQSASENVDAVINVTSSFKASSDVV